MVHLHIHLDVRASCNDGLEQSLRSCFRPSSAVRLPLTAPPARRSHCRRAIVPTAASRRCLCHASDHAVCAALTIAFGARSLRCPATATATGVPHRAFVAAGVARPLDGESSHAGVRRWRGSGCPRATAETRRFAGRCGDCFAWRATADQARPRSWTCPGFLTLVRLATTPTPARPSSGLPAWARMRRGVAPLVTAERTDPRPSRGADA